MWFVGPFELEWRFSDHELMNVLEIIYPQHWLWPNCESTFVDHFAWIKKHYCISNKVGTNGKWFFKPLSKETLDLRSSLFKWPWKNWLLMVWSNIDMKIKWLNCDIWLFVFLSSWGLLNWPFFISLVTWKMKKYFPFYL